MLDSGRPPSDWGQLLAEARAESERLGRLASGGARAGSAITLVKRVDGCRNDPSP
jgi:toxin YhaV